MRNEKRKLFFINILHSMDSVLAQIKNQVASVEALTSLVLEFSQNIIDDSKLQLDHLTFSAFKHRDDALEKLKFMVRCVVSIKRRHDDVGKGCAPNHFKKIISDHLQKAEEALSKAEGAFDLIWVRVDLALEKAEERIISLMATPQYEMLCR